jgi:hypothetical protein
MKRLIISTLASVIVPACATPSQMSADSEVNRLCAIDGGIKVYETVKLPADKFNQYGSIQIPEKAKAKPTDEYYYEWNVDYLKRANPELWRSEHRIVRMVDGKLLGSFVRYSRRGGDMPGPWHDSSYSCPETGSQPSLEKSIFDTGEAK